MSQAYEYKTMVTLGDTDIFQGMYFSMFFNVQGVVRELWVKDCVQDAMDILRNGLTLLTKTAQCEYIKGFSLYDPIICRMNVANLKKASADLVFKFYHGTTQELHARGFQTIVFADSRFKVCKMPMEFRIAATKILEPQPQVA